MSKQTMPHLIHITGLLLLLALGGIAAWTTGDAMWFWAAALGAAAAESIAAVRKRREAGR